MMAAKKKPTKAAPKRPAKKLAAKAPAKKTARAKKTAPAKKTAAKRVAAKVSPLKGMPVDHWIRTKTSGWHSEVIDQLVSLVLGAAPTATVSIKWGQPVFEENGPFAYIKPAKAHVTFGFWRGGEIADPKGLLSEGARMTHMKLMSSADVDADAIHTMVQDAVRLNRAKGNPAVR